MNVTPEAVSGRSPVPLPSREICPKPKILVSIRLAVSRDIQGDSFELIIIIHVPMNTSIYLGRCEDDWLTGDTENSFLPPEDTGRPDAHVRERCSQCWATLSAGAGTAETASEGRLHCSNDPVTQHRSRKRTAQAYTIFRCTARGITELRKWREPDRRVAKYMMLPSFVSVGKLLPDL